MKVKVILVSLLTLVSLAAVYKSWSDCNKVGGKLVRGLGWFECLEGTR